MFYYLCALASLIAPNVVLTFTEGYPLTAAAANVLLPLGAFAWLLKLGSRPARNYLLLFPFLFLAAFQMALIMLYGRSVIATDMFLTLATTNASEASETITGLGTGMIVVIAAYAVMLGWSAVRLLSGRDTLHAPAILKPATKVLLGVGAVLALVTPMHARWYLFPVNALGNCVDAIVASHRSNHYAETCAGYSYNLRSTRPDSVPELYILVIGETSRRSNWQLFGYSRPTNPRLSRRDGVTPFPHAVSASNMTHRSVPMLLSPVTAAAYNDSIYRVRSVISAFRSAGYSTAAISAQEPNHSYIQYFLDEADTTLYISADEGRRVTDYDLLPYVKARIDARAPRQLIVIHTYGSHYCYTDRYPRSMAHFLPDAPATARADNRPALINAYDNSIRLTDLLLDSIASLAEHTGVSAAMLYASDHGEDIFDAPDYDRFMHASPIATPQQLQVAMIAWTSREYRRQHPAQSLLLRELASRDSLVTSTSYFPLALSLAGLEERRSLPIAQR